MSLSVIENHIPPIVFESCPPSHGCHFHPRQTRKAAIGFGTHGLCVSDSGFGLFIGTTPQPCGVVREDLALAQCWAAHYLASIAVAYNVGLALFFGMLIPIIMAAIAELNGDF